MPCSPAGCHVWRKCSSERRHHKVVSGDDAFKLYDTYGLPRDFTEDLASNQGLRFDGKVSTGRWRASAKRRAGSAFEGKKGEEFTFAPDEGENRYDKPVMCSRAIAIPS